MFKYIKRIPEPPSIHLEYGIFVHALLEDIGNVIQDNGGKIPEQVSSFMSSIWNNRIKEMRMGMTPELIVEAKGIFKKFVTVSREKKHTNILSNEKNFSYKVGEANVVGKIDQVLKLENNKIMVRDYKTNGLKNLRYLLEDPSQLKMYAIAVGREFNKPMKDMEFSFTVLRDECKDYVYRFSDEEITEAEDMIEGVFHDIKRSIAENDWEANLSPLCPYCSYFDLCDEAKNNKRHSSKRKALIKEGKVQPNTLV